MALRLDALVIDANDPPGLARFWAGILGREVAADGVTLPPTEDPGFAVRFAPTDQPKVHLNRVHFDLTSTSLEDQAATVDRVLALGGRLFDVGQGPDEDHVVVADPEGNEFCVVEHGNDFLADTARIGCLSSDGTRAVGCFWSEALGWPLIWDQDEETAIQSPEGGSKISWGGPPVRPKHGRNRWHLDLAPTAGGDQLSAVDRLVALGATRLDEASEAAGAVVLADPDGNELCVLAPH